VHRDRYGATLFRDDGAAAAVNTGDELIDWYGELIDRFDGRWVDGWASRVLCSIDGVHPHIVAGPAGHPPPRLVQMACPSLPTCPLCGRLCKHPHCGENSRGTWSLYRNLLDDDSGFQETVEEPELTKTELVEEIACDAERYSNGPRTRPSDVYSHFLHVQVRQI
jgi:hypothetical protein